MMKIVELKTENVKRVKTVEITPDGNMIVIGGRNEQGKSSLLDSIFMAIGGKKAQGIRPVRDGEDSAKIVCDLGEFVVTRTITANGGGTVKLTSPEGAVYSSPQAMLDGLCSRLSFDPLAFSKQRPKDQVESLRDFLGLDFTKSDEKRGELYSMRTTENKVITDHKSRLSEMTFDPSAPETAPDSQALMAELEKREEYNRETDRLQAQWKQAANSHEAARQEVINLQEKLEEAKGRVTKASLDESHALSLSTNRPPENTATIKEQIASIGEVAARVQNNQRILDLKAIIKAASEKSESLTKQLLQIDKAKADAIASAEFPVGGLGFDENGITYKGIPFSQCSSAEQLRVSVAMGIAMNPKLKVLLVRDGSLLDEDNLALIAGMADEHDCQVWIERVGKGEECSVIIEDGKVTALERSHAVS